MVRPFRSVVHTVADKFMFLLVMHCFLFVLPTESAGENPEKKTLLYRGIKSSTECSQHCRNETSLPCKYFKFFEKKKLCLLSSHAKVKGDEVLDVRESPKSGGAQVNAGVDREKTLGGVRGEWHHLNAAKEVTEKAIKKFGNETDFEARRREIIVDMSQANSKMAAHVSALYQAQANLATRIQALGDESSNQGQNKALESMGFFMRLEHRVRELSQEVQELRDILNKTFQDKPKILKDLETMRETNEKLQHSVDGYPTVVKDMRTIEDILRSHSETERTLQSKMRKIRRLFAGIRSDMMLGEMNSEEGKRVEETVVKLEATLKRMVAETVWLERYVDRERDDLLTEVKDVKSLQQRQESAASRLVAIAQGNQNASVQSPQDANLTSTQLQKEVKEIRQNIKQRLQEVSTTLVHYTKAMTAAMSPGRNAKGANSTTPHGFPGRQELDLMNIEFRTLEDELTTMRLMKAANDSGLGEFASAGNTTEDSYEMIQKEEERIDKLKKEILKLVDAVKEMELEMERLNRLREQFGNGTIVEEEEDMGILENITDSSSAELIALKTAMLAQRKSVVELRQTLREAVAATSRAEERRRNIMTRLGQVNRQLANLRRQPKTPKRRAEIAALQQQRHKLRFDLNKETKAFQDAEKVVENFAGKLREARDKRKELEASFKELTGGGEKEPDTPLGREIAALRKNITAQKEKIKPLESSLQGVVVETSMKEQRVMATARRLQSVNRDISKLRKKPNSVKNREVMKSLQKQRTQFRFNMNENRHSHILAQKKAANLESEKKKAIEILRQMEALLTDKLFELNKEDALASLQAKLEEAEEEMLRLRMSLKAVSKKYNEARKVRTSTLKRLKEINRNLHKLRRGKKDNEIRQRIKALSKERRDLRLQLNETTHARNVTKKKVARLKTSLKEAEKKVKQAEATLKEKTQHAQAETEGVTPGEEAGAAQQEAT